jgi:exopolyphosphatase/guanosine-5'-triphosphate,3'-diphosphate pyrophosphatase
MDLIPAGNPIGSYASLGSRRRRAAEGARLAALDLGTNNCRLLVAEVQDGEIVIIDSFSRIVRLGEGLAHGDRLSDAAMSRTIAALRVCARIIARNRVGQTRCVATEACRRAKNGAEFLARITRVTGLHLELLAHDEEARLAMLGCLPLIDDDADHLLMLDIGGGSTELMWLDRRQPVNGAAPGFTMSLPLGVVTLSESHAGAVVPEAYADMVTTVERLLASAGRDWPALTPELATRVQMLGTSGTVTTLAALHLGLRRYDRRKVDGIGLSFDDIETVARSLRELDNGSRAAHPCIGGGRADLVVAGCAILDAVHRRWPVSDLRVADRGVREGILSALIGRSLDEALLD